MVGHGVGGLRPARCDPTSCGEFCLAYGQRGEEQTSACAVDGMYAVFDVQFGFFCCWAAPPWGKDWSQHSGRRDSCLAGLSRALDVGFSDLCLAHTGLQVAALRD